MGHEKTCESVGVEEADNGHSTEWNRELPEKAERELRACVEIRPLPLGLGVVRDIKLLSRKGTWSQTPISILTDSGGFQTSSEKFLWRAIGL